MAVSRRTFLGAASAATLAGLSACAKPDFSWFASKDKQKKHPGSGSAAPSSEEEEKTNLKEFDALKLDMGAWSYDTSFDCYYQLGVPYCLHPATKAYESLAIFVPGPYFEGKKRLSGTYECTVVPDAQIASFTAATAPIMMPINAAAFEAQACPTGFSYTGLTRYLAAGLIYVYAGFRGRSPIVESESTKLIAGGAPWPVVDLKAAIRYLRYNKAVLPGDTSRLCVFGFGGGGGIAASLGSSGDVQEFEPYLKEIGAATHDGEQGDPLSDAISAVASWCPLTDLDVADASYEWMMGQFAHGGTREEGTFGAALSQDLATAYGKHLNKLGLLDEDGKSLQLEEAQDGAYIAGNYYEALLAQIEDGASAFFAATAFPYTYTPEAHTTPLFPGDPSLVKRSAASAAQTTPTTNATVPADSSDTSSHAATGTSAPDIDSNTTPGDIPSGVRTVQSIVYESPESYVRALSAHARWLVYSATSQQARITNLWDFVSVCRPAQPGLAHFDAADRSSAVNQLFGVGEEGALHFSQMVADQIAAHQESYPKLKNWEATFASDWSSDIGTLDEAEKSVVDRVQMISPLYYLADSSVGHGTAQVAPYWRINTGLFSTINSFADEFNLACALKAYKSVDTVDFTPVWGAGFELAERDGHAEDKLVSWVTGLYKKE